jgi:hypothetical protein
MEGSFRFERDFMEGMRCIPMAVRLKLDTCGVKLGLRQWLKFTEEDRLALWDRPCGDAGEAASYRAFLADLIARRAGEPPEFMEPARDPAWDRAGDAPPDVQAKARAAGFALSPERWAELTRLQRFALIKLSRPNHANKNFLPAAREFGLTP